MDAKKKRKSGRILCVQHRQAECFTFSFFFSYAGTCGEEVYCIEMVVVHMKYRYSLRVPSSTNQCSSFYSQICSLNCS